MPGIKFKTLLREWWERTLLQGNQAYARECWRKLEKEVLPELGESDPKKITPPQVLKILRRVEASGAPQVARKIKSHISQAMRYGIACGHVISDPTRDLGAALTKCRHVPRAALIDPREIGQLMKKIGEYRYKQARLCLKFAVLTFMRAGEITSAAWDEIEWERLMWRIPAEKMKMKRPHLVPLATQTLETLRALWTLTGHSRWLFPSGRKKNAHVKAGVLTYALRAMGYPKEKICAHGFRAMAATTLSDHGWPGEVIERQLAHIDQNRVRAAYQRSELLSERAKMMQAWADFLDLKCAHAILGR